MSRQYTSVRFAERLADAGISASVGSVGNSFDNALAETINGLYKTEVIKHRGPWRTVEQVEFATAEWVDWFNHRRLYEYCGDIPPAELEAAYYRETQLHHPVGSSETKVTGHTGVIHGSGVLPLHPDGASALLHVAGLVEHQHGVRVTELIDHVSA